MTKPTKYQKWWMTKLAMGESLFEMHFGNDFTFIKNELEYVCWRSFKIAENKGWIIRKHHRAIGKWYLELTPAGLKAVE